MNEKNQTTDTNKSFDHQKPSNSSILNFATILLIVVSVLMMIGIGYDRAAPFIRLDEPSAMAASTDAATLAKHIQIWKAAVPVCLLTVLFFRKRFSGENPLWYRLVFTISLAISFALMIFLSINIIDERETRPDQWNVYYVAPDTQSYVHRYFDPVPPPRPPVYPLFIQALTSGTGFSHDMQGIPRHEPLTDAADPLMRVVRVQKLLLIIASLVCCFMMMKFIDAPLVALLFLALYDFGFYTWEINYILTETLTQAQVFLMVGIFLTFLKKPQRWLLPAAGFLCATLYLTRPASVYSGLFFAGMLLWGLVKDLRQYMKPVLLSILLAGVMVSIPSLHTFIKFGNLKPTPMYYGPKIAYALQVAQPEDISIMPDEQSKAYLAEAIVRRDARHAEILVEQPDDYMQIPWLISANLNEVAMPLANEILAGDSKQVTVENLLMKVAQPILEKRRIDHLKYSWNSFLLATTKGTRLNTEKYGFWNIMAFYLLAAVLLRGWQGYSAVILILGHLMHVMTVCIYDAPTGRYVEAAEFLVLIALFILCWAILDKIFYIVINWQNIWKKTNELMIKKLAINLTEQVETVNENEIKQNGIISAIFTGKNHDVETVTVNIVDSSQWRIHETLHYHDSVTNQTKIDDGSAQIYLYQLIQKAGGEWLAFIPGDDVSALKQLTENSVPSDGAEMVVSINPAVCNEKLQTHLSRKRPLGALTMALTGFPVCAVETETFLIRKQTALALFPYLPKNIPLHAAFGAVLKRAGQAIEYTPAQHTKRKGINSLIERLKQIRTTLQLVFNIYPMRITVPAAILLCIPGFLGARRVLSGGGGYVSLFVALLCLLGAVVFFLFGYLYDQLVLLRCQQAYYSERNQATQ